MKREIGTVKLVRETRRGGYGFISRKGKPDMFFSFTNWWGGGAFEKLPYPGLRVSFTEVKGKRGLEAVGVKRARGTETFPGSVRLINLEDLWLEPLHFQTKEGEIVKVEVERSYLEEHMSKIELRCGEEKKELVFSEADTGFQGLLSLQGLEVTVEVGRPGFSGKTPIQVYVHGDVACNDSALLYEGGAWELEYWTLRRQGKGFLG